MHQEEPEHAITNYKKSLKSFEKHNGIGCQESAKVLNNLGCAYEEIEDLDKALEFYK